MSSTPPITCSPYKKPAASSKSDPGVRIVIAAVRLVPRDTTRISSGSSVATRSETRRTRPSSTLSTFALVVLPGHGPRFQDVPALTNAMRHHHDARADEILQVIDRLGEATPYQLSGELFPHIQDFSIMLGVSEVVGHLDLLEDDGRLVRSDGPPHRYAPT